MKGKYISDIEEHDILSECKRLPWHLECFMLVKLNWLKIK